MTVPESEYLRVARIILRSAGKPLSAREIVDRALEQRLLPDRVAGRTPWQTTKAKLSVHIKRYGDKSDFVRSAPGRFTLRALIEPARVYRAEPHRPPPPTERVLVFPTSWLDARGRFHGIETAWRPFLSELLTANVCTYRDRVDAECDDSYKQIICYVLVTRRGKLLAFNRGSYSRAEDALRGRACVGFGGHASEGDRDLLSWNDLGITSCAIRELQEELSLPAEDITRLHARAGLRIIGLLNDDSSAVGRRHFAIVFRYEVSPNTAWEHPERNERAITQLRWLEPGSPSAVLREFEYWSQLCLKKFFHKSIKEQPSVLIRRKRVLQPPHVLVVLGALGSGKSETTAVLRDRFGYTEINSGKVVAELLGRHRVTDRSRADFQNVAWRFINREGGPELLATEIWRRVQDARSPKVVIDGIRQPATLAHLRRLAGKTTLGIIFVYTPPDVAYRFYSKRSENHTDILEFLLRRDHPVEREIPSMIREADIVLYNWFGRPAHRRVLGELMKPTRPRALRRTR